MTKSNHPKIWYCAETHYGCEHLAKTHLAAQGFEVELPLTRARRDSKGVRKALPLFEGYIFFRGDRWRSVNGTRGIQRVILNGDVPSPILDEDLQFFRDSVDELGYFVDPVCRLFQPGDSVSPRSGRFAGIRGEFVRMKTAAKAEILYWMMGRGRTFNHPVGDLV